MTIIVKVGKAKTHLSNLLAKVEAGEEVIILRGNHPIAKLSRIPKNNDLGALIEEVRARGPGPSPSRPRRFWLGNMKAIATDGLRP